MELFKPIIFIALSLYCLVFSIYSGYTADNNRPNDNSKGLFIASYVICIVQCIIYMIGFIYVSIIGMYSCSKKPVTDENGDSKLKSNSFLPLLLNIYWLVVHFNYDISDNYNDFAKVKMIEFFVVLVIFVISVCVLFVYGFKMISNIDKNIKKKENENENKNNVPICTQV